MLFKLSIPAVVLFYDGTTGGTIKPKSYSGDSSKEVAFQNVLVIN